jgi:alpha/beta superfamily hydrolase
MGAVVLAGPHPLLGGNMHNNVVRRLGDGLARHHLVSLRFNYRGVGQSEGPATDSAEQLAQFWQTSRVPAELEYDRDLAAAIAFLRPAVSRDLPLALVGYSFGCTLLARCLPAAGSLIPLVFVAPTLAKHDYEGLETVTQPKLIIASDNDFAADAGRLRQWFDRLAAPKQLVQDRLDSHFFRGHEEWLVETVKEYLQAQWRYES